MGRGAPVEALAGAASLVLDEEDDAPEAPGATVATEDGGGGGGDDNPKGGGSEGGAGGPSKKDGGGPGGGGGGATSDGGGPAGGAGGISILSGSASIGKAGTIPSCELDDSAGDLPQPSNGAKAGVGGGAVGNFAWSDAGENAPSASKPIPLKSSVADVIPSLIAPDHCNFCAAGEGAWRSVPCRAVGRIGEHSIPPKDRRRIGEATAAMSNRFCTSGSFSAWPNAAVFGVIFREGLPVGSGCAGDIEME